MNNELGTLGKSTLCLSRAPSRGGTRDEPKERLNL